VLKGKVMFFPKKLNFESYTYIFKYRNFWQAYGNTVWYTVVGTLWGLTLTMMTAYPLSRKNLKGKGFYMIFLMITMYFGGGMIPGYILIKNLHLIDTRWVMVVGGVTVYYLILARTFLEGLPDSLVESAQIDGCTHFGIFLKIILPLSKAIIAVLAHFYAVDQWNGYFTALIYLNREELLPVQILLQRILINFQMNSVMEAMQGDKKLALGQGIRYAMIIITILPILCVYPFIQKYFVKGVMLGSLKG
jgi:ABC-type glycerol-3-phosphate transport system permease component